MSDPINDGWQAFAAATCGDWQVGMTLRAWMTGKILAGFAANPAVFGHNAMSGWGLVNCNEADLAGYAAKLADEAIKTLAARKETEA